LLSARSYADWLGLWFSKTFGPNHAANAQGRNAFFRWVLHDDAALIQRGAVPVPGAQTTAPITSAEPAFWQQLHQRLSWEYPFMAATRRPAKTSVSVLRRLAADNPEADDTSLAVPQAFRKLQPPITNLPSPGGGRRSATDIGSAHHALLQLVSLAHVGSVEELKQEAARLRDERALTLEELALLDFEGLAAFWESDLGRKVRAQAPSVKRELAFTVRFSPKELAAVTGEPLEPGLGDEFVVVQGVVDLAVVLPAEIWLLDFKTDTVSPRELGDKIKAYGPQLKLYARALSKIYQRPVSSSWLYFLAHRKAVALEPE